ncbi:MAG: hypothetical protein IJJ52_03655 [Lachnospiraceae bacterium]|nr:hypothetical protein [Lachnospiraceae bacterium]
MPEQTASAGNCSVCGKKAAFHFRALEVRTLHVRDLDREKKVQALGGIRDFYICSECAENHLRDILSPRSVLVRKCLPFALILAAGTALAIRFFGGDRVFFLLGLMAVFCGAAGILGSASGAVKKRELYRNEDRERALYHAAFETACSAAPKKDGDTDLTYIPIDEETKRRKNGDLMILYNLLPEIAVEAYKRIHSSKSS